MEDSGNTTTTAQIYSRNLKAIFNRAIKAGYIPERLYPFKHYVISAAAKSKMFYIHIKLRHCGNMNRKASVNVAQKHFSSSVTYAME